MKKSDLKEYIKEEIISVLSETATDDDIENQKELNKELEKTKELVGEGNLGSMADYEVEEMGYEEGEKIFSRMRGERSSSLRAYFRGLKQGFIDNLDSYNLNEDIDGDEGSKSAPKGNDKDPLVQNQDDLAKNKDEIQSVLNKFKNAKGAEKEKYVKELKALGKIKTELEKLSLAENKLLKQNKIAQAIRDEAEQPDSKVGAAIFKKYAKKIENASKEDYRKILTSMERELISTHPDTFDGDDDIVASFMTIRESKDFDLKKQLAK